MKTYDDCKKQVAEKHGFSKWRDCLAYVFDWDHDKFYAAVSVMYAQAKANEAVKEDREQILKESFYEPHVGEQIVLVDVTVEPLPFPDEK